MKNAKVYLQYVGDEAICARLESGGEKIEFEKGDIHLCDVNRAVSLSGAHKFVIIDPLDADSKGLKKAKDRAEKIKKEKDAIEKANEKIRKENEEREAKEVELRAELAELKSRYNKNQIDLENYEIEKKKITEKWAKKLGDEIKAPKKEAKKEEEKAEEVEMPEVEITEGSD